MSVARVLAVAALAFCSTAQAQLFRAYLASDGSDANPCTLPAPCRLLPAALNAVASGGEIWMLDSANYNTGAVHITKSVSILAVPGAIGSVVVLNGDGLVVSTADLEVTLRNLSIGPVATSPPASVDFGVILSNDSSLNLDRCVIANLWRGVRASAGALRVVDSVVQGMVSSAFQIQGTARATILRSSMLGNGLGVYVNGNGNGDTASAVVSDSTISGNGGGSGVRVELTTTGAIARGSVSRTLLDTNFAAIQAVNFDDLPGSAFLFVSGSTLVNNQNAFYQSGPGATIYSRDDNHVANNTSPGIGAAPQFMPPQ